MLYVVRKGAIVLFTLVALMSGARATSPEGQVKAGASFVDANNFILFSPTPSSAAGTKDNVEVGQVAYFSIVLANTTSAGVSFKVTAAVTQSGGTPTNPPTVQAGCSNGCQWYVAGLQQINLNGTIDATNASPGTYQLQLTATDASSSAPPAVSPVYNFVISSPAATLASNSLKASTMMTINLSGTKMIYFGGSGIQAAADSSKLSTTATDTTLTTTTTTTAGTVPVGVAIMLILNNVGTSVIVITDGNNSVTLGAGDVIAATFFGNVTASVTDGTSGSLRVAIP
jgi:hypothetical protein